MTTPVSVAGESRLIHMKNRFRMKFENFAPIPTVLNQSQVTFMASHLGLSENAKIN